MSKERELTDEEVDALLELVLPCETKAKFELRLAMHANQTGWGEPDADGMRDGKPIERFLWGLGTRLREYRGPVTRRTKREGPASYTEQWLIDVGTTTDSLEAKHKRKGFPDAAYFAILFNREQADAAKIYKAYGPAKNRDGLFG